MCLSLWLLWELLGTRPVKQVVLWQLDLQGLVSQYGVGFLLGQEVLGSVAAAQQSVWVPAGQTDFSSFPFVESSSILRVDSNLKRGPFLLVCLVRQ